MYICRRKYAKLDQLLLGIDCRSRAISRQVQWVCQRQNLSAGNFTRNLFAFRCRTWESLLIRDETGSIIECVHNRDRVVPIGHEVLIDTRRTHCRTRTPRLPRPYCASFMQFVQHTSIFIVAHRRHRENVTINESSNFKVKRGVKIKIVRIDNFVWRLLRNCTVSFIYFPKVRFMVITSSLKIQRQSTVQLSLV